MSTVYGPDVGLLSRMVLIDSQLGLDRVRSCSPHITVPRIYTDGGLLLVASADY